MCRLPFLDFLRLTIWIRLENGGGTRRILDPKSGDCTARWKPTEQQSLGQQTVPAMPDQDPKQLEPALELYPLPMTAH
jgi:hypothetical protein